MFKIDITIGNISKHVAVFDNHILKIEVDIIIPPRSPFLLKPIKLSIYIAKRKWRLLFWKPKPIIKPPSNKKITGLEYGFTTSTILKFEDVGTIIRGNKAVIESGIVSVIHQNVINSNSTAIIQASLSTFIGGDKLERNRNPVIPNRINVI